MTLAPPGRKGSGSTAGRRRGDGGTAPSCTTIAARRAGNEPMNGAERGHLRGATGLDAAEAVSLVLNKPLVAQRLAPVEARRVQALLAAGGVTARSC